MMARYGGSSARSSSAICVHRRSSAVPFLPRHTTAVPRPGLTANGGCIIRIIVAPRAEIVLIWNRRWTRMNADVVLLPRFRPIPAAGWRDRVAQIQLDIGPSQPLVCCSLESSGKPGAIRTVPPVGDSASIPAALADLGRPNGKGRSVTVRWGCPVGLPGGIAASGTIIPGGSRRRGSLDWRSISTRRTRRTTEGHEGV
jgi:hypothetical protein